MSADDDDKHDQQKDRKILFIDNKRRSTLVTRATLDSQTQIQGNTTDKRESKKSFNLSNIETVSLTDDTDQDDAQCNFRNGFGLFKKKIMVYTPEVLDSQIHKLHKYCLTHLIDSYRLHINREKGVDLIDEILLKANFLDLRMSQVVSLIWCTISCVHHFYLRLHSGTQIKRSRKKEAQRALRSFENLLEFLLPEMFPTVIQAIFTFFNEANVWEWELLSIDMIKTFLYVSEETDTIVHGILDIIEESNVAQGRKVVRILCEVLETFPWEDMDDELMSRILEMYHRAVVDEDENDSMKKGLEMCLRNILDNMDSIGLIKIITIMLGWCFEADLSDDCLLDFGSVLEYAAIIHDTSIYHESIPDDVFPQVLKLISSDNVLRSLLGNRVLQHLLDRQNNRLQFDTPRLFFEGTHFNVKISRYQSVDKLFIKKYREMIHIMLLTSVELHGSQRINLDSTYTSIALILVEVPCGFTAAAMVCLAMAMQETTLSDESLELESTHRLHATVMAIMSLVCWIHEATVFYEYLNTVIARRAELAPHLNPPLEAVYQYGQHHVLWNKPELFFEDWEARYGLWKCFKIKINKKT